MEIPFKVIEKLSDWNKVPLNQSIDRNFILALLLILVEKEDITKKNISESVREFIQSKIIIIFLGIFFSVFSFQF